MAKFKVGDRVRIINKRGRCWNINGGMDKWMGKIMTIRETEGELYRMVEDKGEFLGDGWTWREEDFAELVACPKILITTDGTTTLARLYDGKQVIKSAEAKCAPSDKFDFTAGANIAYDRLMGRAKVEPKPAEKPQAKPAEPPCGIDWKAFEAGEIVVHCDTEEKATAFLKECEGRGYKWRSGEKPTAFTRWERHREKTIYDHAFGCLGYAIIGGLFDTSHKHKIVEYRLPQGEPKPAEPVKLYCVKDKRNGVPLTKGKVYEFVEGGLTYDNGFTTTSADKTLDAFFERNSSIYMSNYLIPLVKRPAKVGEWVYVLGYNGGCVTPGTVWQVTKSDNGGLSMKNKEHGNGWRCNVNNYLVLDGYKPEEKE